MKKEIKVILDTDQARQGLRYAGCAELYKDSDERVADRALNYIERFGFELAPEKPALNADVEKTVTIKINTKVARTMLGLAGYHGLDRKSDQEIFEMAMDMVTCYGVTYEESENSYGAT